MGETEQQLVGTAQPKEDKAAAHFHSCKLWHLFMGQTLVEPATSRRSKDEQDTVLTSLELTL